MAEEISAPRKNISDFVLCKYVKRNSSLTETKSLMVADYIASYYNSRRGYSLVGINRLVEDTRISRSGVIRALKDIEESGEWVISKAAGGRNAYYPVLERLADPDNRARAITERPEEATAQDKAVLKLEEQEELPLEEVNEEILAAPASTGSTKTGIYDFDITDLSTLTSINLCVKRLKALTPIQTRSNPTAFTEKTLTALYGELVEDGFPLDVIDSLMFLQCSTEEPLNIRFLRPVLKRCVKGGNITEPKPWKTGTNDPTFVVAKKLFDIMLKRRKSSEEKYSETL